MNAHGIHVGMLQPDDRRHGAFTNGNGRLHGIAANAQEPRGIGERKRSGSAQGRIFAERMAGDIGDLGFQVEPFGFQDPKGRDRHRHQRRLGVRRQRQRFFRAVPHDIGELFAERLVHFGKDGGRLRKGICQVLAHAERLTALSWKCECDCHEVYPRHTRLCRAVSFQPIAGKHKAGRGFFLSIHIPGPQVQAFEARSACLCTATAFLLRCSKQALHSPPDTF